MRISDWSSDVCSSDLEEERPPAAVAPACPDGFRLEGELPRVMRLSRKTLALAGGAAGLAIGGALLWALRTPDPKPAQELYEVTNPHRADSITGGPADHGPLPNMGPPIPGDLGSPPGSDQKAGATEPQT